MLGLKTCIIDSLESIGGQCTFLYPEKPIYDIPGFKSLNAQQLIDNLAHQALCFNSKHYLSQKCIKIIKSSRNYWTLETSKNILFSKTIIIACGAGTFEAKKPAIKGISAFESKSVFYHIDNLEKFRGKTISIAGGGDSALDWTLVLSNIAKKIYLIHRRDSFKGSQAVVEQLKLLCKNAKVELVTPYQLKKINGEKGVIHSIEISNLDGDIKILNSDYLLPFYGMSMNLGPVEDWGLKFHNRHIQVDFATMETNIKGVYAVGDACYYLGKLKLITTGFAESARACHSAYNYINPNTPLHFQHSTTKGVPKQ